MITYKVTDEILEKICDKLNDLLILGVVPGYCMDIVRGHASATHQLDIYDTGAYNFQIRIIEKNEP